MGTDPKPGAAWPGLKKEAVSKGQRWGDHGSMEKQRQHDQGGLMGPAEFALALKAELRRTPLRSPCRAGVISPSTSMAAAPLAI